MTEKTMVERIYGLMIEGHKIEDLMIDGRQIEDPEADEILQVFDILREGQTADRDEYDKRMSLAAARLDEYMEGAMNDGQFDIASGLSGEYEYEARLDGFVLGFKVALQLMKGGYPARRV